MGLKPVPPHAGEPVEIKKFRKQKRNLDPKQKKPKLNTMSKANKSPKSPYGKQFLESQKDTLLALRDALSDNNYKRPESEAHADEIDAASSETDFDFALSMLSNNSDALLDIHEALMKIDNGTYGLCEVSGKIIPKDRLLAIPYAKATMECQAQLEKQKKIAGRQGPRQSVFAMERAATQLERRKKGDIDADLEEEPEEEEPGEEQDKEEGGPEV